MLGPWVGRGWQLKLLMPFSLGEGINLFAPTLS